MKSKKSKRSKSKSKKSKSSKKEKLDETLPHAIKEKIYTTKEIETSITLLESPEYNLVLEALLFLSKYADIQRNNLVYVYNRGLMPKLLALLDHNICIIRVALRLLSQLLTVEAAQVEFNQEKFDEAILKICRFYISHQDVHVKEFSSQILATYATMGKVDLLVTENAFINSILKTIKDPETDPILNNSLDLFYICIELEQVRKYLPEDKEFNLEVFLQLMDTSEKCFLQVLQIFEKMTYFSDDVLQQLLRDQNLVEHMFNIIIDPEKKYYAPLCLNIVKHCMCNEITSHYFTTSLEFLKFAQWSKTCSNEVIKSCATIFLDLAKIDSIRQMLFDLSIEDTILSFLRSEDKSVLNKACEAISFMSKHKYCCEKMITPVVLKKLLEIMQRQGDGEDPENEMALSTLHYFCRRDSRTIHMISTYDGIGVVLKYLKEKTDKLSRSAYTKVLEIVNMFVTNNQLRGVILCPDLYDVILKQTLNKFDEICMRSVEIMINCLGSNDFQNYFLLNKGTQMVVDKLADSGNEQIIRLLIIFVHNALMQDHLAKDFVHKKLLLVLKNIPESVKYRNPLIQRVINLIYDMCLPVKFFETGKLELTDRLKERFYVINGPWEGCFPFLEVLELRRMSTLSTIYVVDECGFRSVDSFDHDCVSIQQQNMAFQSPNLSACSSVSSMQTRCTINYGLLSHDPFLPKYFKEIKNLLLGVTEFEEKIKVLAKFVDKCLCGPDGDDETTNPDKIHTYMLHLECLKTKLGTNMIPIGYLRLGFHCERALLFKALADHVYVPVTFVKGKNKLYWNEVALRQTEKKRSFLKMFVVDLMNKIGQLLPVGSRECNVYCDIQ